MNKNGITAHNYTPYKNRKKKEAINCEISIIENCSLIQIIGEMVHFQELENSRIMMYNPNLDSELDSETDFREYAIRINRNNLGFDKNCKNQIMHLTSELEFSLSSSLITKFIAIDIDILVGILININNFLMLKSDTYELISHIKIKLNNLMEEYSLSTIIISREFIQMLLILLYNKKGFMIWK